MTSKLSEGEPLTPYYPQLNYVLRSIEIQGVRGNKKLRNVGDEARFKPPILVYANNQVPVENQLGDALSV